jgi:excisionase family DNA binding protein
MEQDEKVCGLARIHEATRFLGVSRTTVYRLMEDGQLAYVKFGKSRRIDWSDVYCFIATNKVHRGQVPRAEYNTHLTGA